MAGLPSPDVPVTPQELYREFSKSGVMNYWMAEQSKQIRIRSIVWETYFKANMIEQGQLDAMKSFEQLNGPVNVGKLVERDGPSYISLLITFLGKIVRVDTVQYLLALLDEALLLADQKMLDSMKTTLHKDAFHVLARCLSKEDEYTQVKAAKVIAELFCSWSMIDNEALIDYLKWIESQLSQNRAPQCSDVAIQCLQVILRHPVYRNVVFDRATTLAILMDVLKKNSPSPQLQYQCVFCLWLLSFEARIAAQLHTKYEIIPILLEMARAALKEKVVRVCLATLRNMLVKSPSSNTLPMIGYKLLPLLDTFVQRKWSDDEIKEDIQFMHAELTKCINNLSTWDEYESELKSGKLEWSPAHTSEHFWKQNAQKLNIHDHELLRTLARILCTSSNPVALAVACFDIGQYVKHYPQGKKFVQDLGAKQQIMELMTHDNAEVRYNALLAVQQYMTNAWYVLRKSSGDLLIF